MAIVLFYKNENCKSKRGITAVIIPALPRFPGDLQTLLQQTKVAEFSGTTGFTHSRSKAGGDVAWAHPFMGTGNNAYIANGAAGVYSAPYAEPLRRTYMELSDAGYTFPSWIEGAVGEYQLLPDGACTHYPSSVSGMLPDLTAPHFKISL